MVTFPFTEEMTLQEKELETLNTLIKPVNKLHLVKSSEHYTPQNIIELSREVLEVIDLDPFSCEFANSRVNAYIYFNEQNDGLKTDWCHIKPYYSTKEYPKTIWEPVSVFLNPPSKLQVTNKKGKVVQKSGAKEAWNKLIKEVALNHVTHAIVIAYSLEQLQVTQKGCEKSMCDFPLCIASERFAYVNDQGIPQTNGSHSSAIIYVPNLIDNSQKFKDLFSHVGKVLNVEKSI
jgi:hypothetical protein